MIAKLIDKKIRVEKRMFNIAIIIIETTEVVFMCR